jgi:hypothetical protein
VFLKSNNKLICLILVIVALFAKQWPLAGEFVKFKYSPKIRQFWRIRVLAKMVILENWLDSIHSPDIPQPFSPDLIHSPDIRQPFPRTRYIRSHSTFAIFEKNVTRLDTFARVIRHFGEFGASGHCLSISHNWKKLTLRKKWITCLADF